MAVNVQQYIFQSAKVICGTERNAAIFPSIHRTAGHRKHVVVPFLHGSYDNCPPFFLSKVCIIIISDIYYFTLCFHVNLMCPFTLPLFF
jgi:hypothetical protein